MSQAVPPLREQVCPECGAANDARATVCWMCRRPLAGVELAPAHGDVSNAARARTAAEAAPNRAAPSAAQHAHFQFGLASLMLTVTLCAVILGAGAIWPGLGIVLAIMVAPAFLHTAITAARRQGRGQQMDPVEKMVFFFGSLGAVVVTLVAAGIAFFATCFAGFFAGAATAEAVGARGNYAPIGWGMVVGNVLGGVVGLVVLVLLVWFFVKRYRRRAV